MKKIGNHITLMRNSLVTKTLGVFFLPLCNFSPLDCVEAAVRRQFYTTTTQQEVSCYIEGVFYQRCPDVDTDDSTDVNEWWLLPVAFARTQPGKVHPYCISQSTTTTRPKGGWKDSFGNQWIGDNGCCCGCHTLPTTLMTPLAFFVCLCALLFYVCYVDPNVFKWLTLQVKLLYVSLSRLYLLIKLHPRNPLTNRGMSATLKEFAKQIQNDQKS